MSNKKVLGDRRQALEDQFFKDVEAKKVARVQAELAAKNERVDLSDASGIEDEQLLDALMKLDVHAGDMTAMALIPLVRVAWADGTIQDKEREAVLKAAHDQGVTEGSHSHTLLQSWLDDQPGSTLYEAWARYVEAVVEHISTNDAETLKDSILGLAHDVASAAGGILGIGTISASEEAALDAISDAFKI